MRSSYVVAQRAIGKSTHARAPNGLRQLQHEQERE
jgi:hypothetical protein